jgi:hypothetical protein
MDFDFKNLLQSNYTIVKIKLKIYPVFPHE